MATALQAFGFPTSLYGLDIGYCGSESKDCTRGLLHRLSSE